MDSLESSSLVKSFGSFMLNLVDFLQCLMDATGEATAQICSIEAAKLSNGADGALFRYVCGGVEDDSPLHQLYTQQNPKIP